MFNPVTATAGGASRHRQRTLVRISSMNNLDCLRTELNGHLLRYGRSPTPRVATGVVDCLERLILHPDFHADIIERCVCKQMLSFWRVLAEPVALSHR
jgi:hypothetical protein